MNKTEYLLAKVAEEAGEVAQMAAKCQCFGINDHHPHKEKKPNIDLLVGEVNDLLGVMEMLISEIGYTKELLPCVMHMSKKIQKVEKWMRYSRERGCLEPELKELRK